MTNHADPPRLAVGDTCALLRGTSLYDVTISEVRVLLEGDRAEFAMYCVTSSDSWLADLFKDKYQHRSDLFKIPGERRLLIDRLEADIDALQYKLREQESAQEQEDEDAIPHGPDCDCTTCQHERAADTANEVRHD